MVTSPKQVHGVREMLATVLAGRPSRCVGAMMERAEEADQGGEIARVCDFLSLGTNDLTQLVLGLDREQSKSAPVANVTVLRLIDATMRAARGAGIAVDVCGEAASDAAAMPIMVGLGADDLSVAAARDRGVRACVRGLDSSAFPAISRPPLLRHSAAPPP